MTRILYKIAILIVSAFSLLGTIATAQDTALVKDLSVKDDRGFIVGLLEDALGGEGRIVRVEGFQGAFSSKATIEEITVSDDEGIWLTLESLVLVWNRSALLRGRIKVQNLSATTVTLERLPLAPEGTTPSPEASGFSLPNLPVSITVDQLKLERIVLGKAVLGEPVEMKLTAAAKLAEGSGDVALTAIRIDGKQGQFIIDAGYDAASETALINLDLQEAKDGITARILDLPGRPDLRLKVAGEGSIDDLVTDISLETDGAKRLAGQVVLRENSASGRDFGLNIDGDLTPLLPMEYHDFFGTQTALSANGNLGTDGTLVLSDLALKTGAVALQGMVSLDPNYWPTQIEVSGQIKSENDNAVTLPFADGSINIDHAKLVITFDASQSDDIEATFDLSNLVTPDVTIRETQLTLRGELENSFASQKRFQGDVSFNADGAQFSDEGQQQAIGSQLTGSMQLKYETTGSLRLDQIQIAGNQYVLSGTLETGGLSDALETDFDLALRAENLKQYSKITNTTLGGKAEVALKGKANLGGVFELRLNGRTTNLAVGIPQADRALSGLTELDIIVIRDMNGTQLPRLKIQNDQLDATGSANLKLGASNVEFDLKFADSSAIDPSLKGPLALKGNATQDALGWSVATSLRGPFDATSTVKGRATGDNPSLVFQVTVPEVQQVAKQFRGSATLAGTAKRDADTWKIDTKLNGPYNISGQMAGTLTGNTPNVSYKLNIPNVGALGAQIDGPLDVDGTAGQRSTGWQIDTTVSGLSGLNAQVNGLVQTNGDLNLATSGVVPLALANPFLAPRNLQGQAQFNIDMRGPPSLSSMSGTVTTTSAQLSVPTLGIALNDIASQIGLNNGRVQIDVAGAVSSGGRIAVRGPITLTETPTADLAITISNVQLLDPSLYNTSLNGGLTLQGPLTGGGLISGQIDIGETNIQVPASAGTGFTIVPQISHINPSQSVRRAIHRAGLDPKPAKSEASAGSEASFRLDVQINAASRIFVRGRGLDAELGGALNLSGRTDQLISAGRFDLIRGKLDILGKRFELDEGSVALQGSLDPILRFVATTQTSVGTASITIDGSASEPTVTFSSLPESPQDEVLAQIFFDGDTSKLSAFQALQLAEAVATLAGKGGEGVISSLRRGFGLDNLDVTTDAQGGTGLRLGKYLSDNIYTDVTIGTANTAGVSINIDLTRSLTARGQVKSNGDSSVGIFFEKDY